MGAFFLVVQGLWKLKAFRIGVYVAAGLLVLGFYTAYIRRNAIKQGQQQGRAEQLEVDAKDFEKANAGWQEVMQKGADFQAKMVIELEKRDAAISQLNANINDIARTRVEQARVVSNIPDMGLFNDIVVKLQVRKPEDATPAFYPAELRKVDNIITDYPSSIRLNETLEAKVTEIEHKVSDMQKVQSNLESQLKVTVDYANLVTKNYVAAYNVAQQARKRPLILKILTFGLLKDRKIDLPAPVDLDTLKSKVVN